jgi:hypothetical protein
MDSIVNQAREIESWGGLVMDSIINQAKKSEADGY